MRSKKVGLFVIVALTSWVAVSYVLFFYCPSCINEASSTDDTDHKEYEEKLLDLERKVEKLVRDYEGLFSRFGLHGKESLIKKLILARKNVPIRIRNKVNVLVSTEKKTRDEDSSKPNLNTPVEGQDKERSTLLNNNVVKEEALENRQDINNTSSSLLSLEIKMRNISQGLTKTGKPVIPVLVISCNRLTVRRCLDQLLSNRPSEEQFPIIVSQDCSHEPTTEVIQSYGDKVTLIRQPDQSEIPIPPKEKKFKGYFKIARHYGWALNQIFYNFQFETAIIVEDDLDIAPDFFEYFSGTYWLLKNDPSLWCISAWNDNGKSGLVDESQPDLLYRTDFFPGLGWMLRKNLWMELSGKWPKSYWDDWIRKPEQRKGRACIRPELPRTRTFGKIGVSNGMFYEKHLKFIKLNDKFVEFSSKNLSYLLKENYDASFIRDVYKSHVISFQELRAGSVVSPGPVRIPYYTKDQYKKTAKSIGLMDDFKSGVPRTAYRGVVTFSYNGRKVYLAPSLSWKSYDVTWS